jgi:Bax protein
MRPAKLPPLHASASRGLLLLLCLFVLGLFALVSADRTLPHVARGAMPEKVANGAVPPITYPIRAAETKDAVLMQAALDRIGFDLDAVAGGYMSVPQVQVAALPPDIERLASSDARKTLFLRLLLPIILTVNDHIGADRQKLLALHRKMAAGGHLSADEVQWILDQADIYDEPGADIDALLKKIDVVPPSLALAQAIEESGWGTSRIARQGNALFGQFGQDAEGEWDYRSFATLNEAVAAYAHNLNTHPAYREFRQVRAKMRGTGGDIDAWNLAATLHRYSERGEDYVQSLRAIMRINELGAFDSARLNQHRVAMVMASVQ